MDLKNRIGLYGSYFLGVAAIGFTLPYLPLYLGQRGMSDRSIGLLMTVSALTSLAQFPVGLWSDRIGWRKPFLLVALAVMALATALLPSARGTLWLGVLVVLFAENGVCRACLESLAGAEAASLAPQGEVGRALGSLRFWKPTGIVLVALVGSWVVERHGVASLLMPLAAVQGLGFALALLIHEGNRGSERGQQSTASPRAGDDRPGWGGLPRDTALWTFVAAMVLFHMANAPGGVYLGLFLERDLLASRSLPAYAFVVSMVAWMLVVRPAGLLADRWGRRPLLIACWALMAIRLGVIAVAGSPWVVIANQALDGAANGMFAVLAAAWVTDRLADPHRSGEAQVIVGCSLVLGSAIGPALTGMLVGPLGYRAVFALLAVIGAAATALVITRVPETLARRHEVSPQGRVEPMGLVTDLSTTP